MPVRRSNRLAVTVGSLGGLIALGQFAVNLGPLGFGLSSLAYLSSGLLLLLAVVGEMVPPWRPLTGRALLVAGLLVVVSIVQMLSLVRGLQAAGGPIPVGFGVNVAVNGIVALAALGVGTSMLLASPSGANATPTA